jgi:hypothetical protein
MAPLLLTLISFASFGEREGEGLPLLDTTVFFKDMSTATLQPVLRKCYDEEAVVNDENAYVHILHTKSRACQKVLARLPYNRSIRSTLKIDIEPLHVVNSSSLFAHLKVTVHNSSTLLICAETSGLVVDLACYRTNITATVTLKLKDGTTARLPIRLVIHLADLGWLWPHFGGPPTSRSFMQQMKRIHERWDSRLTFGMNQTVVIFDGGYWTDKIPADALNAASVVDWLRPTPFGHGRKCVAALDEVGIEAQIARRRSRSTLIGPAAATAVGAAAATAGAAVSAAGAAGGELSDPSTNGGGNGGAWVGGGGGHGSARNNVAGMPFDLKQFGHGTDIYKLVASKSRIADDPYAPSRPVRGHKAAGVSLGVAFNAQVNVVYLLGLACSNV